MTDRVMLGEEVTAEVTVRVAPNRVDMVAAALGVVVFGEQPRALDAVVVRLARLGAAGPGEVQLPGGRAGDLRLLGLGGIVGEPVQPGA